MTSRTLWIVGLIFTSVTVLTSTVWWKKRHASVPKLSSKGGRSLQLSLKVPLQYLQADSRWADDTVGGSGETLRNVGCTLCSVATAMNAQGTEITPAQLNRVLKDTGGYTDKGWMIWSAVTNASAISHVEVVNRMSHDLLDAALEKGDFPIAKFWLPQGIPHWVLLTGKNGDEYLALDPLRKVERPVLLSSLTNAIHSCRIVRRKS